MKKLLLVLSAVFVFSFLAQAQDVITYDFETCSQNPADNPWTYIDADGDGYCWLWQVEMEFHYAHSGYYYMKSESYKYGHALTPDNYLVLRPRGNYKEISFWARAEDVDFGAEHFGVAVSTSYDGYTASGYQTIQEWTITAKRDGAQWHEYTADLSAFTGQEIWVAIRHFDCTDQWALCVDDVTLTESPHISEVIIEGFVEPREGEHPNFELESYNYNGYESHFTINEVRWYKGNTQIDENYVFTTNENYRMYVFLTFEPGYIVDDDLYVTLDPDITEYVDSYYWHNGEFVIKSIVFRLTGDGMEEAVVKQLKVYPNPSHNILYLESAEGEKICVYDAQGRLVKQEIYSGHLNIDDLQSGIYSITCSKGTTTFVRE